MSHIPIRLVLLGSKLKISYWFWERSGVAHGLLVISFLYTLYVVRFVLITDSLNSLTLAIIILTMAGCFLITGVSYAHGAAQQTCEPLKEKSDVYAAILRAHSDMGEAFFIIDKQKVIYANEATKHITGYSEQELMELPSFLMLVVPEQRKLIAGRLLKRLSGGTVEEHYETALIDKHGERKELEVAIKTFIVQGTMRLAVLARDITQRKTTEEAKGEFISWLAHQLRTPVTMANWQVESLCNAEECPLNTEQKASLDQIYEANQLMLGLINDLLHMTKLEMGTFQLDPEPTDVPSVVESIAEQLSPLMKRKHTTLSHTFDPKLPLVEVDPNVIRIILQNLLSNALKYTSEGGHIDLELKHKGDTLLVIVSDDGCGVPAKDQSKIFEKYFRSSNAKKVEGTGLGLYIVHSVVEQSGGEVRITSQEGKGTTITVALPERVES